MKEQKCEHCGETCYDTEDMAFICDKCLNYIRTMEKEIKILTDECERLRLQLMRNYGGVF